MSAKPPIRERTYSDTGENTNIFRNTDDRHTELEQSIQLIELNIA